MSSSWLVKLAEQETPSIFEIPVSRLAWLDSRLAKLAKVAQKLKLPPPGYKKLGQVLKNDPSDETGTQKLLYERIELYGETPKLNGWKFVARILHTADGNIFKAVPGETVPSELRTAVPKCEHCGYKRRRNDTFLLENDQKQYRQVGSSCLKDFLGHGNPEQYAAYAEVLSELGQELGSLGDADGRGGGSGDRGIEIMTFLHDVFGVAKKFGWKGRAKAKDSGETATVDSYFSLLYSKNAEDKRLLQEIRDSVTADDDQMLEDALLWVKSMKDDPRQVDSLSDYYWNLSVACSSAVVTHRTAGIVASLPAAFMQSVLSKIQPQSNDVVGAKGQKVVVKGIIQSEKVYDDTIIYEMKTDDGRVVRWSGVSQLGVGNPAIVEGVVVSYTRSFLTTISKLSNTRILNESEYESARQAVERQNQAPTEKVEYIDGQKVTVDVTVLKILEFDTQWGVSTLYKMVDRSGVNVSVFSNALDISEGEQLNITGTVKIDPQYGVQLKRIKINSRSLQEGAIDRRLTAKQIKELKARLKAIDVHISQLTADTFADDNAENLAIDLVCRPILMALNVDWSMIQSAWGNSSASSVGLLQNAQKIQELVPLGIEKLVKERSYYEGRMQSMQSNAPHETDRRQTYPQETQWMQERIDSLNKQISNIQSNADTWISAFQKEVPALLAKVTKYRSLKPEIEKLQSEAHQINERISDSKVDTKAYGPKTAYWTMQYSALLKS